MNMNSWISQQKSVAELSVKQQFNSSRTINNTNNNTTTTTSLTPLSSHVGSSFAASGLLRAWQKTQSEADRIKRAEFEQRKSHLDGTRSTSTQYTTQPPSSSTDTGLSSSSYNHIQSDLKPNYARPLVLETDSELGLSAQSRRELQNVQLMKSVSLAKYQANKPIKEVRGSDSDEVVESKRSNQNQTSGNCQQSAADDLGEWQIEEEESTECTSNNSNNSNNNSHSKSIPFNRVNPSPINASNFSTNSTCNFNSSSSFTALSPIQTHTGPNLASTRPHTALNSSSQSTTVTSTPRTTYTPIASTNPNPAPNSVFQPSRSAFASLFQSLPSDSATHSIFDSQHNAKKIMRNLEKNLEPQLSVEELDEPTQPAVDAHLTQKQLLHSTEQHRLQLAARHKEFEFQEQQLLEQRRIKLLQQKQLLASENKLKQEKKVQLIEHSKAARVAENRAKVQQVKETARKEQKIKLQLQAVVILINRKNKQVLQLCFREWRVQSLVPEKMKFKAKSFCRFYSQVRLFKQWRLLTVKNRKDRAVKRERLVAEKQAADERQAELFHREKYREKLFRAWYLMLVEKTSSNEIVAVRQERRLKMDKLLNKLAGNIQHNQSTADSSTGNNSSSGKRQSQTSSAVRSGKSRTVDSPVANKTKSKITAVASNPYAYKISTTLNNSTTTNSASDSLSHSNDSPSSFTSQLRFSSSTPSSSTHTQLSTKPTNNPDFISLDIQRRAEERARNRTILADKYRQKAEQQQLEEARKKAELNELKAQEKKFEEEKRVKAQLNKTNNEAALREKRAIQVEKLSLACMHYSYSLLQFGWKNWSKLIELKRLKLAETQNFAQYKSLKLRFKQWKSNVASVREMRRQKYVNQVKKADKFRMFFSVRQCFKEWKKQCVRTLKTMERFHVKRQQVKLIQLLRIWCSMSTELEKKKLDHASQRGQLSIRRAYFKLWRSRAASHKLQKQVEIQERQTKAKVQRWLCEIKSKSSNSSNATHNNISNSTNHVLDFDFTTSTPSGSVGQVNLFDLSDDEPAERTSHKHTIRNGSSPKHLPL